MSTPMALVGALTSLSGCGPSCEGLLDTSGRDALSVSVSTGATAVSGPGRSCGDNTNGVGAMGISSTLRPVSSASKAS